MRVNALLRVGIRLYATTPTEAPAHLFLSSLPGQLWVQLKLGKAVAFTLEGVGTQCNMFALPTSKQEQSLLEQRKLEGAPKMKCSF